MKEGYIPSFQTHKEGGGGLTPHGLDPYANNGEKSMANAQNNEPVQRSPQDVDNFSQLPLGGQFESLTTPNTQLPSGEQHELNASPNRSGYEQAPIEGNYKTIDEIYETAKAMAEASGENINDVSRERRNNLFEMAKNFKPSDFEYVPENREFIPPPPRANIEVPFTPEVQEELQKKGFGDPEKATRNTEAYLRANPGLPPEIQEYYRQEAARGVDMTKSSNEGSGKLRTEAGADQVPRAQRESRERRTSINDMNELLEEIMAYSDNKWKKGHEMSLVKTITTESGQEQEVVNQENFMHWVQDRIVYFHGEDPDTAINMFTAVKLEREFKDIPILEMINNQDKYFRDKYKNQYTDLANFVRLTLWQFSQYRTDEIEYRAGMGDDSGLNKIIAKQFYNNSRSKPGFDNMSVFANVLTMANRYDSHSQSEQERDAKAEPPKKKELDTNLGNAINTAFLTYFRISDPEKLKEILGEQVKYLLDENELRAAVLEAAKKKGFVDKEGEFTQARRFLESTTGDANNSADFLFSGGPVKESQIIEFINIFNVPTKNTDIGNIVNGQIRKAIAEKFDLRRFDSTGAEIETGSAAYAQLMAYFMARPMGAGGRNDLAANANDAIAKPMKLKPYRLKMARGDRAGMVGNPYTVFMLKSVLVDYLNGSRTETLVEDDQGKVIRDNLGNTHYYTQMELMEMMSAEGVDREGVMKYAKRLRPTDISQRDWAQNHMNRGFEMFHDITESNELDWSKFTEEDNWGNLRLNRGNFEKEFKDHFLKQMRYAYSTYGQLDFSKTVRDYDAEKKEWVDVPLVDTLFAKQVLNVEEFWKKEYKKDKDGNFILGKDKKRIPTGKVYEGIIDPNEIQDNKKFLWKQLAIARIAADIRAHVDFFSTDPRHKPTYYLMMLEAIESIQDELVGDEYNFKRTKKKGHAFTHDQIKWLREAAGITDKRIYLQQAGEDLAKGLGKGFAEALQGTLKSAFKIS